MKVVNPLGRNTEKQITINKLTACYCGTSAAYATAKSEKGSDTCLHCGCGCTSVSSTGTYMHAQVTIRKST